jgi:hypothetical protein
VCCKYLNMRLIACRCEFLGDAWKWVHRHNENWMSSLVAVKYRSDPIMLRYSFWSTCSPSSSASRVVVVLIGIVMALESSILNFLTMFLVYFAWCTHVPSVDCLICRPNKNCCDNPPRKIPYYHLNQSTLVIKQ